MKHKFSSAQESEIDTENKNMFKQIPLQCVL